MLLIGWKKWTKVNPSFIKMVCGEKSLFILTRFCIKISDLVTYVNNTWKRAFRTHKSIARVNPGEPTCATVISDSIASPINN